MNTRPVITDDLKNAVEHIGMLSQTLRSSAHELYEIELEKTAGNKRRISEKHEDLANHSRDAADKMDAFCHLVGVAQGRRYDTHSNALSRLPGVDMVEVLKDAKRQVETIEELRHGDLIYATYPNVPDYSKADKNRAVETIEKVMIPAVGDGITLVQQLLDHAKGGNKHPLVAQLRPGGRGSES